MFRHYRVILRDLAISTVPSYTSISNAAVGNTVYNQDVSHRFYASSHLFWYFNDCNNQNLKQVTGTLNFVISLTRLKEILE